jgi:hypothetical protein
VEVERGAGGVVLVLVCGVSDRWGRAGVVWTHPDFLHVTCVAVLCWCWCACVCDTSSHAWDRCRQVLVDGPPALGDTPSGLDVH